MAFLYKREDSDGKSLSRFWWVSYVHPKTKKRICESTGFLFGNGADTRRAHELEARRTLDERKSIQSNKKEEWDAWVPAFIDEQYKLPRQKQSRTRYHSAWRTLRMYLDEIDVTMPRQLTYKHCDGYLKWREDADPDSGKYKASHDTAVLELKFFALVMKHAVREGFCESNPCREMDLKRESKKKYPQLGPGLIQMIVDGIQREPEKKKAFLWPSFLIAYYHGVRLNETYLNPMQAVKLFPAADGKRIGSITFYQKGDKIRVKPLHPELRELLFDKLIAERATQTFEMPKSFAKEWHNFFHRCGVKEIKPAAAFHSFRVTVQNRLRRKDVSKEVRKAYLSHDKKEDVNEMYDRIDQEDFDVEDFDMIDEMLICHEPLNRTWVIKPQPVAQPPAAKQILDVAA